MIKAGTEVPEYQNVVHHIVAGGVKKTAPARAVLNKFGIGVNDTSDGMFYQQPQILQMQHTIQACI